MPTLINSLAQALSTAGDGYTGGTSAGRDTTGANFIVVAVSYYQAAMAFAFTDSFGNTWSKLTIYASSVSAVVYYYCFNPTVGPNHTFATSGANVYSSIAMEAWSGVTTSPFDKQNGTTASSLASIQTGSITPSVNGELILACIGFDTAQGGGLASMTIDDSFTGVLRVDYQAGVCLGIAMAHLIEGSANPINPTWSWVTPAATVAAAIASFKSVVAPSFNPAWAARSNLAFTGGPA